MDYVIGIDVGGTKSHLALFDTTGTLVDFAHWGGLNHEGLPGSFKQFNDEMTQYVTQVLSKNKIKIEQITSAVFGLSGTDTKAQYKILSDIMTGIGFKKFILANDAFLGIPAGSPLGTGICAINGTGCTLAGINKEGKMLQIGGVGYISADYGGGGFLGRTVISTVYSELFRKGEPTCLTPALFEILGITDKYDYVDRIYKKFEEGNFNITGLAKMLFDAAMKNDKVSLDILRDVGLNYANGIRGMIDELDFNNTDEDLYIIFAGSVFVKGKHPMMIDTIKEKLSEGNYRCNFKYTLLKVPPVAGAVFWALNNLGVNDRKACYDKVCAQLNNV
jgi:N-acetylglucosamine kinase-like BadF-type ATPase